MKIGILSDLHLESSGMDIENPGWDLLILAGDISVDFEILKQFIANKLPDNIPILYVLGNHEFEGKIYENVVDQLKNELSIFPNIQILYNESVIHNGIKFIGSTLWTDFLGDGERLYEEANSWAKINISAFKHIFTKEDNLLKKISPSTMEKWARECQKFLEYELKKSPFNGERFVITHFAPHPLSRAPRFSKSFSSFWINNLEPLMGFSDYWVHGHTHDSFDYNVEGTRVICNPRGSSKMYDLSPNVNFDKKFILDLSPKNKIKCNI